MVLWSAPRRREYSWVTDEADGTAVDSELIVPSSVAASIAPILRVADEIPKENPRIAYLCHLHALKKVDGIIMDQKRARPDICKFGTRLLRLVEKEDSKTKDIIQSDSEEILTFYRLFWEKNIKKYLKKGITEREQTEKLDKMGMKFFWITRILYEVLNAMVPPEEIKVEIREMADEVNKKLDWQDEQHINVIDSERVPSSLATSIAPILRIAKEIQSEYPRISYLCRFYALEKVRGLLTDQLSIEPDVREFKTHLARWLEKEKSETTNMLASSDPKEILSFYHQFWEENIKERERIREKSGEMSINIQIARILYEVLRTVAPLEEIDPQTQKMADDVNKKTDQQDKQYHAIIDLTEVPSSLATSIGPILNVASEIQKEKPRVAYLCRFYALQKIRRMAMAFQDQNYNQSDIRQCMINLSQRLEKDEMGKLLQIARILYEVLKTVFPEGMDPQTQKMADDVSKKTDQQDKKYYTVIDPTVPSSLAASIGPILHVANEIQKENTRVANLCRFHALQKVRGMLIQSEIREYMTYLSRRLEKEEIVWFYHMFWEKNIREIDPKETADKVGKLFRTAKILYEVLKTIVPPEEIDTQTRKMANDVRSKMYRQDEQYNILPLKTLGAKPAIMELPEIKAVIDALGNVKNLPMPRPRVHLKTDEHDNEQDMTMPREIAGIEPINDILDWLCSIFGFQKGNVSNQREHLILLLANIQLRRKQHDHEEYYTQLDCKTVHQLEDKVLENYNSWCAYLHCESNYRFPDDSDKQQLKLVYIALYLLIWGEASNIRFMPECLCYIFHNMAKEVFVIVHGNIHPVSGEAYPDDARDGEYFLRNVITPLYDALHKEAKRSNGGSESNSRWRNYDDFNEYFWSTKCFRLGWPMDPKVDFFRHSDIVPPVRKKLNPAAPERKEPKTNFVELRTFCHLYRNFDRTWTFFTLAFQVTFIVGWSSPSGSPVAFFDANIFASVLSIFVTWAFLNFLRATLDIILSMNAWKNLKTSQIVRYLLKFAISAFWVVVISIGYYSFVRQKRKRSLLLMGFFSSNKLYTSAVAIYLVPNLLAATLLFLPPLRRAMKNSKLWIITLLMWWTQEPKLYVGRGMHEDMFTQIKYSLFWTMLLTSKLAFSYYVEILPLIRPTKLIMEMPLDNYQWHELFLKVPHNSCVVIAIWAPTVLVYFMDAQIWYAILSVLLGWIYGTFSHLREIGSLGMLWFRFESVPSAFSYRLISSTDSGAKEKQLDSSALGLKNLANFAQMWNGFINTMRLEDLISNREKDLLLVPYPSQDVSVTQWPLSLLASKIPVAQRMAEDFKGKEDANLFGKIKSDDYMYSAVIECYETLRDILYGVLEDEADKMIVRTICYEVNESIDRKEFLNNFRMSGLPALTGRLEKFLGLLLCDEVDIESNLRQIIKVLQDIMEVITEDVMINGHDVNAQTFKKEQWFEKINIYILKNKSWKEKVVRLFLVLTFKQSAVHVPYNLEARHRITFFVNSLFMNVPSAPEVRDMLSFSVLTPYYKEDVLYTNDELLEENEDGISILFYLQKIYPDEWANFMDRRNDSYNIGISYMDTTELILQWVSYRGQTLSRTVRGIMYYRQALELQCLIESTENNAAISGGDKTFSDEDMKALRDRAQAFVDLKFTCVVSCQAYGSQKKSTVPHDQNCYHGILKLMQIYPTLRVAYIETALELVNGRSQEVHYSVLVKGSDSEMLDEEVYRIKLPGPPMEIGEAKAENQNHAIIFTRGEALQTIGVNQDLYYEEAIKMRNVLEEFQKHHCRHRKSPTILGVREHVFSESVSSLACFMSTQENGFAAISQRILANPLRVHFDNGHSSIYDRIFHITRGGISKASRVINSKEEIFAGFNSTLRGGLVSYNEYIQVGKGRQANLNQISLFEAKVAIGNGEQTLSRDVYRLGRHFDFYRMLSFYFTTVGFYFSILVAVLAVYVYLYGRVYMVMSGLEKEILKVNPVAYQIKALEETLATQSIFQMALWMILPVVMETILEKELLTALQDFIIMHLQQALMFFIFQLGTKAHHYGRTILHRGFYYEDQHIGGSIAPCRARFVENYRLYSRSHFIKGLEMLMLLLICEIYGEPYVHGSTVLHLLSSFSVWFIVPCWLFTPFVFNPSCFEWRDIVNDWTDWGSWIEISSVIGITPDKSWESWWDEEYKYLKHTNIRGKVVESLLALRFLIYQYGIVYHLDIVHQNKSFLVYGLSWVLMVSALIFLKIAYINIRRYSKLTRILRSTIPKALSCLVLISVMTDLFLVYGLTASDLFAASLAFLPTGWALVLMGQTWRGMWERIGIWESIKELARAYDYMIGVVIFMPIAALSWLSFVSEFQRRFLFYQGFSRGLQISMFFLRKEI